MKLCFVVHRYAPFPGGSEYYVQQMAEEALSRGHDVTVLAGEHKGDLNGVKVTSEVSSLINKDLVIVHGGDVHVQNYVLSMAKNINSPILYLIIKPSDSPVCLQALKDVKYIGCSSLEDWNHVQKWKVNNKWNSIAVKSDTNKNKIEQATIEEFIFERYYGFTKLSDSKTQEYKIRHPKWMTNKILNTQIDCDFISMYGDAFSGLNNQKPDSIILAEGSEVSVDWKREQF